MLLVSLAVVPAAALASPIVAVGDQHPQMFKDPQWKALHLGYARYVAPWNLMHSPVDRAALDDYLAGARAAHARVLLAFGHARQRRLHHVLPSVAQYTREFRAIHARYPGVTEYEIWNEANLCGEPSCRHPERIARFYNAAKAICRRCRIVGADLLNSGTVGTWARRFRAVAKGPLIWGLHNYVDANLLSTHATQRFLSLTQGSVWFTETGGVVKRKDHSRIRFPSGAKHAGLATRMVFKLAALSSRVKRVYFYQWMPDPNTHATWDSALVDRHGRPRPALGVLRSWLLAHKRRS
jgi:polysaccharide biosynthesis protein PslG